jgi:hypothetical protein
MWLKGKRLLLELISSEYQEADEAEMLVSLLRTVGQPFTEIKRRNGCPLRLGYTPRLLIAFRKNICPIL